jgi:hypothetical protein
MYNVKDYSFIYNNAVRSVICQDWHFTNTWKALASPHHFTKREGLTPSTFYWSVCTKPEHWCCGYIFCLFMQFWYLILELVQQCQFFFSFINTVAFFFPLCDCMVVNFISTDVIGAYHLKRMRLDSLTLPVLFCISLLFFWPWCCLLRYTDSDYPFGIFKLFLIKLNTTIYQLLFCRKWPYSSAVFLLTCSWKYLDLSDSVSFTCYEKEDTQSTYLLCIRRVWRYQKG